MQITPAGLRTEGLDASLVFVWDGAAWTEQPLSAATAGVTATGAAAAAVTLTIPAVALRRHILLWTQVVMYSTAARTGTATPVLVTTTNLPGNPVLTFPSAGAIGAITEQAIEVGVRSVTVNTVTTIVCPATTAVIWRINAQYLTI